MTQKVDILLVEDNADDIELAVHALREEKLANNITIARDGEEALDHIFSRGEPADAARSVPRLILLDLKMPRLDGIEVLKAIRADPRTRRIPVVMMTSSQEETDVAQSYDVGVNSYIVKPVDFGALTDVTRQVGFYWLVINQVTGT